MDVRAWQPAGVATRPYTWDQLRRLTLGRQFGRVRGRGAAQVAATLHRAGPVQAQTARSVFLGVAARLPGVDHAAITDAYEQLAVVRGSTLRGTVHAATPQQHVLLDRATRVGLRPQWERILRLQRVPLEAVWADLEEFAETSWRTPAELRMRLRTFLTERGETTGDLVDGPGRYLAVSHSALIRRPLRGGWEGQGAPGYRTARSALAEHRPDLGDELHRLRALPDPEALAELVLLHLRSHGPATREDVAWWSGLPARTVAAAVEHLGDRVAARPGPDGLTFLDVAEPTPRGRDDVGTRLLPEFDALLCGYQPRTRTRFVTADQHAVLWNQANGLLRAPLLHEGRIAGHWRADGTGRRRRFTVTVFPEAPSPPTDELEPAVRDAATAMGWTPTDLELTRAT